MPHAMNAHFETGIGGPGGKRQTQRGGVEHEHHREQSEHESHVAQRGRLRQRPFLQRAAQPMMRARYDNSSLPRLVYRGKSKRDWLRPWVEIAEASRRVRS